MRKHVKDVIKAPRCIYLTV